MRRPRVRRDRERRGGHGSQGEISHFFFGLIGVKYEMKLCLANFAKRHTRKKVKVVGYITQDASHDSSRDGEVTVILNIQESMSVRVLWSNGVVVMGRALVGIRPGQYAAIVLSANNIPVTSVHDCEIARVSVKSELHELQT